MAPLRLIGEIVGVELTDKIGERVGNFIGVRVSVTRVLPFRPGEGLIGHPILCELFPHMRHVRREMNISPVLTPIDVRAGAPVSFRPGTALQPILAAIARNRAAVGERQRFLQ